MKSVVVVQDGMDYCTLYGVPGQEWRFSIESFMVTKCTLLCRLLHYTERESVNKEGGVGVLWRSLEFGTAELQHQEIMTTAVILTTGN